MNNRNNQTSQKLRGGYYTPGRIADFLSEWLVSGENIETILEPSAGDGAFVRTLHAINPELNVSAVEIVSQEANVISEFVYDAPNYQVINEDFYDFYQEIKGRISNGAAAYFDGVIGNPPYIRYQYLTEEQRDFQTSILENNGMQSNRLVNAWMAFTVASVELVRFGGRIAFVLPTDLLQVSYAKQLREFLFQNLSYLTVITFEDLVFEDIQQDVILLLGEKISSTQENDRSHNLRVVNLSGLAELDQRVFEIPFDQYREYTADKWTKFYLSREQRLFYEDILFENMLSFNHFATGQIGVTTGNNDFFVVSDEVVNAYNMSNYARPTLGRSVEVKGVFYTQNDLVENQNQGQKVWMLDFNNQTLNVGAKRYVRDGEEAQENRGYKLSLRQRWFDVPSIWIPDAFLLRRIGEFPRILLNEIGATSTDTFHRIRFIEGTNISKFLFLMYSSPALLTFELEGRVFGGGALEILPGDLVNIKIPIVDDELPYDNLIHELDTRFRNRESIRDISLWVNETIKEHTNLSNRQIDTSYEMWQTLKLRRVGK